MTPEEMNTQLYEKLTAEQAKYRDWLMGQPPEEILNHAYEYAVREDILAAAELMDMPQAQAAALLAEKKEAYAELRKARDEAQELLIVKANVDRILQNTERGGNAQEKGTVSFAANCALY